MKKYLILIVCMFGLSLSAQSVLTGYNSNSFTLQSSANASAFPEANFVIGFPGLSNVNIGMQLPLSLNEILKKGSDDSLRLSLPLLNSSLLEHNLLSSNIKNQLFQIGFKVGAKKNVFVYVGDEIVVDAGMQFSDKFVSYLTKGNASFLNQQMDFSTQKMEMNAYNSFYLGSAVKVNEKLEVGARIKILRGIANVHTNKFNLGFYTDSTASPVFATTLTSDMLIQTSGQGVANDTLDFDPMLNSGFAFDFGASYKITHQLSASFALNDLGSITWDASNNNLYSTEGEVEFLFTGLTQSSAGGEDLQAQMEEITDSLLNVMEPKEINGSYKTKLNPSMYLGVSYDLNEKHHFSGLFHSKKSIDKSIQAYSLAYQLQLAKSLEFLASIQNIGGVNSIGSGFVWSPGPLQMHFVLDNILVADVFDAKNFFVQMGLSFHFGRVKKVVEEEN